MMIKKILFLYIISCSFLSYSQETAISDENFESFLEANGMGNGIADDHLVTTANISTVITLDVSGKTISDLTGIEDFTDLQELNCDNNALTSLDVSSNNQLVTFNCSSNQLTRLNVKNGNNVVLNICNIENNPGLECVKVDDPAAGYLNTWIKDAQSYYDLSCGETYVPDTVFENYLETHTNTGADVPVGDITSLGNGILNDHYVTTATIAAITNLIIRDQSIVDLTGLEDFVNLERIELSNLSISTVDFSQNSMFDYIQVNDNINLTTVNITQNTALTDVKVYDNANLGTIDFTKNVGLTNIDCSDNKLSNLDITKNVLLERLKAGGNLLTDIDVTKNILLKELSVSENQLSNIDLSKNVLLERFWCVTTLLTSIDFSKNIALNSFFGNDGIFETLDFSQNTLLRRVNCKNNNLTSLNLKNGNNALLVGDSGLSATGNPNLTCIKVDDANNATATWTDVDTATVSFSEHCYETYVSDDNFENYLETHDADGGTVAVGDTTSMGNGIANDDYVITSRVETVTTLSVVAKGIVSLTGIENFTALEVLNCQFNDLKELDLSKNTALTTLTAYTNDITSLDLSTNSSLVEIQVLNNELTYLNVANGNNSNITTFNARNNTNLTCINIDDETASYLSSWTTDASASFNEHCYETYVEDTVFENYLETHTNTGGDAPLGDATSLGNGILNDNYVTTATIAVITNLIIRNESISDLTGLEDFVNLERIELSNLAISNVDFSQNSMLDYIKVTDNINLTSVNITQNTALTDVQIYRNVKLTDIDFTQNIALIYIRCSDNKLSNLDVTKNVLLEELRVSKNLLMSLDVTKNILLKELSVSENQLPDIDLSKNVLLERIWCVTTHLTSIDFSKNIALNSFYGNEGIFETLDFSQNPLLRRVNCENNNLTSLDLKNGNNALLVDDLALSATGNPNLTCIQVDDADYSARTWSDIDDAISNFSEDCSAKLNPIVFLQGAMLNPNTGEENLMRDDLRIANIIPEESPYTDGATCDASVFATTGNFAIVDWVELQLRDATDASIIVESKSALLTRNGFIVDVDGTSSIRFNSWATKYYVTIQHRNHLGIMTSEVQSLDFILTPLDFSTDATVTLGGTNALTAVGSGVFAMVSGDNDANGQIQNSDINSVIQQLGTSGYFKADMDMNGQVQNSDINNVLNPNIGKGQQY